MLRDPHRWAETVIPLLAFVVRLIPGPRTIDDAFITFRYARNLLDGHGFVYNPGEYVLGTTTPLFALTLAALGLPTGGAEAPFPVIALLLGAAADGVTVLLLVRLGDRLGSFPAGVAAALIWAIHPWSVTFAIGGMETSFFVALLGATFYLHLRGQPVGAAATAGLALLTRPDALLFILPLAIDRASVALGARRRCGIRADLTRPELLAFGLPVGTWVAASLLIYDSPIPQSVFAKAVAYRLPPDAGLVRLLQHYATPFVAHEIFGIPWIAIGLVLFPMLFALGALFALRSTRRSWPLLIYPWIYLAAYAIANPLLFRWYLVPPMPIYLLVILLGGARLSRDLKHWLPLALLTALGLSGSLFAWTFHPDHGSDRPAPKMAFIKLELLYERAAADLKDRLGPDDLLAAADIGALGYYTEARILDLLGLISPQSTQFYPLPEAKYAINYAVPPALVTELEPEYVVILEAYGRNSLLMDDRFRSTYVLEDVLPTDIYGSDGLLVFSKSGSQ